MIKLTYIHTLIHGRDLSDQESDEAAFKAVAAGLRRGISAA
jgi:hypothetical protein